MKISISKIRHTNYLIKINPFIYRTIIICVYSICIYLIYPNYFPFWIYYIIFSSYLYGFLIFIPLSYYKSSKGTGFILDFILVSSFSFYKDPSSIAIIIYLFLPIINLLHYSGKKYRPLLFIGVYTIYYLFLYYIHYKGITFTEIFSIILAFSPLYCYSLRSIKSAKINNVKKDLFGSIDNYYCSMDEPSIIYKKAIKDINIYFKNRPHINNIFCFLQKEKTNKLIFIDSTIDITYNLNFSIPDDTYFFNDCSYNAKFSYNDTVSRNNIVCRVVIKNDDDTDEVLTTYYFIVDIKEPIPIVSFYNINTISRYFFKIMGKRIYIEKCTKDKLRKSNDEISDKTKIIDAAVNTMHFIRNRLTPYQSLLDCLSEYKKAKGTKKKALKIQIESIRNIAEYELKEILNHATFLLQGANNRQKLEELEPVDYISIFKLLRQIWNEYFNEDHFNIDGSMIEESKKRIKTNLYGLDILFSDWISNMKKYSYKQEVECSIKKDTETLKIIFTNSYLREKENDIMTSVSNFNNKSKEQITKKTTFGLYNMNVVLSCLKIKNNMSIDNSLRKICLSLFLDFEEN